MPDPAINILKAKPWILFVNFATVAAAAAVTFASGSFYMKSPESFFSDRLCIHLAFFYYSN